MANTQEALMLDVPEEREESSDLLNRARSLVVADDEGADEAGAFLLDVKRLAREIRDSFEPLKKRAHETHKAICAEEKRHLEPLERAERTVKGALAAFVREREEMRRRVEEERRREEARRFREQQEREAAIRRAQEAEEMREAGVPVAPVQIPRESAREPARVPAAPAPVHVAGVSTREIWRARVVDMAALVAHVAKFPELLNLLTPNERVLNGMAAATKAPSQIPGVEYHAETVVSART